MCSEVGLREANAEQSVIITQLRRDLQAVTASKDTFKNAVTTLLDLGDEYANRVAGRCGWASFDRPDWLRRWCAATRPIRHLKEGSKEYWRLRALDAEAELDCIRKGEGEFPRNA